MRHPEALWVPILMLVDYFLTLAGAVLREKKYSEHFKIQDYELNPIWKNAISGRKWFNPRHLVLTFGVSVFVIWVTNQPDAPEDAAAGLLGCFIGAGSLVVGRHISNLLTFHFAVRNPDAISGQVVMSHQLLLAISTFQTI